VASAISPVLLTQLSTLIESLMGLHFPPERWGDLERRLQAAAPAFSRADGEACAQFLVSSVLTQRQIEILAVHLTVGETYFFREPRSFEVLEEHILPQLINARRGTDQRLRFWSAACCTGEEPYSLAIVLHRILANLQTWRTIILATDISPHFLQRAAAGVYSQWSFRNVPSWVQERYFCKNHNGQYAIHPSLKEMVHFTQLNLVADIYPSFATNTNDMDVIICRNVLIYFTHERTKQIIENFYRALNNGGWLIVSPVETAYVFDSPFTAVQFPGVTLFRKDLQQQSRIFMETDIFGSVQKQPVLNCEPLAASDDLQVVASEPPFSALNQEAIAQDCDETTLGDKQQGDSPVPAPSLAPGEETIVLYAQGRYAEVIEKLLSWDRAAECESIDTLDNARGRLTLLARAYANLGNLEKAQLWCERAIAADKFDPRLHYLRATILLEQGQEPEARLSLTRALYLDQHFVLAHFSLGNLARQHKDFKGASKHFANAMALLERYQPEEILPESEGMTAGRLAQIISAMNVRS
jgi:chemotaxis protein methyltransferase CheR